MAFRASPERDGMSREIEGPCLGVTVLKLVAYAESSAETYPKMYE